MTDVQIKEYKGFPIFVLDNGQFIAKDEDGETEVSAFNLRELEEKLDKISKKKIRMRVFIHDYAGLKAGNLTSLKEITHGYNAGFYCRVSYDGGTWGEVRQDQVFEMTPENSNLAAEHSVLIAQGNELHKKAEEVLKKMTHIKTSELIRQ